MRGSVDLSQGVPLRELSNLGQTPPSRPLIAPALAAIRRRKARLGEEVTKSICFAVAEPPPPLRRLQPDAVSPARPSKPNTGPCQHWLTVWSHRTGNGPRGESARSVISAGLDYRVNPPAKPPPPLLLSSLHTVVALQPVYSHTPRGTLTSDPWWLMQLSKRLQIWRQNWLWEHSGRRFFIFTGSFA